MNRSLRWSISSVTAAIISFSLLTIPVAAANPATPVPVTSTSENPLSPENCNVAPRPAADFLKAADKPGLSAMMREGTPVPLLTVPAGATTADAKTVDQVTSTIYGISACINANDMTRVATFMTDRFLNWFFGGITDAEMLSFSNPKPLPDNLQMKSIEISNVLVWPDGRVSAELRGAGTPTLMVFEKIGDQFLLDRSSPIAGSATPTP